MSVMRVIVGILALLVAAINKISVALIITGKYTNYVLYSLSGLVSIVSNGLLRSGIIFVYQRELVNPKNSLVSGAFYSRQYPSG